MTKRLSVKLTSGTSAPPVLKAKAASTPVSQPGLAALRRAKAAASERIQAMGKSADDAIDVDDDEQEATPSMSKSPFSATNRRAKQERANAIKSLEGRAKKGCVRSVELLYASSDCSQQAAL
jgi:hypothetical protein